MRGQVIWFNVKDGYGFIRGEDNTDYFAHYSKIKAEPGEFRTLQKGERVEFDPQSTARDGVEKPQAHAIKILGGDDEQVLGEHGDSNFGRREQPAAEY